MEERRRLEYASTGKKTLLEAKWRKLEVNVKNKLKTLLVIPASVWHLKCRMPKFHFLSVSYCRCENVKHV